MHVTAEQLRLLTLCALRHDGKSVDWSLIARHARRAGGLDALYAGEVLERTAEARAAQLVLRAGLPRLGEAQQRVHDELEIAERHGAKLVTVLDRAYPANLLLIANLPPFLFILGDDFHEADLRSVAVVGTRNASAEGVDRASRLARELVAASVTVVSGLARGIDTAAHTATLEAGGRTIAVVGTGLAHTYPPENRALSQRITERGIVVSQFWPSTRPARWTFPRRNVVMSGLAQGTVVVEAKATSGAKMQARLAYEHGKRVFVLRSLTAGEPWARRYVDQGKAIEVSEIDDVLRHLASCERITALTEDRQLSLDLGLTPWAGTS